MSRHFCLGASALAGHWWWRLVILSASIMLTLWWTQPVLALDTCYAVADNHDTFVSLEKGTGKTAFIGKTGRKDIEAIAFQSGTDTLFAADASELGTINIVTGLYTPIGAFGSGNGSAGLISLDDVDGLSWDKATNTLYGVARRIDGAPDLLFQIDPATGAVKPGAFNGADYITVGITQKGEDNIDDLAFHPLTGVLYAIANIGGTGGTLVTIDKNSGAIQEIGTLLDANNPSNVIDDMEGLSFFNDGNLYGSTGDSGPDIADINRLFSLDLASGQARLVGAFPPQYGDYEALACLTADIADDDQDSIVNAGEDVNHNGNLQDDNDDGDQAPDYLDSDDDNDTVPTIGEDPNGDGNLFNDDTDADGIANYRDADDDNDGSLTAAEDANQDGNPANDDSDGDGVADYLEGGDSDGDGALNQVDTDDDGDGIPTAEEKVNGATNLFTVDSDNDGKPNFLDADDDGDSIPTLSEDGDHNGDARNDDADRDNVPNYLDTDSDGDSLGDSAEWSANKQDHLRDCTAAVALCTSNDADADGAPNFLDLDSDNDGVPDQGEPDGDPNGNGIPNWLDAQSAQWVVFMGAVVFQK